MSPEDEKRLEREHELFLARRGPDYGEHEKSLRLFREEMSKRRAARAQFEKQKSQRWRSNGER